MTFEEVRRDPAVRVYITQADASMQALGFTEHSFAHVSRVSQVAGDILKTLGYPERTVELARIAGYLHDIGNIVNRVDHSQSGAVMAFRILDRMNFPPEEIATRSGERSTIDGKINEHNGWSSTTFTRR